MSRPDGIGNHRRGVLQGVRLVGRNRELAVGRAAVADVRAGGAPGARPRGRGGDRQERAAGGDRRARRRAGCSCSPGGRRSTSATCRSAWSSTRSTTTSRRCIRAGSRRSGAELGAVLPSAGAGAGPGPARPAERFRYHRALRGLLELLGRERPVALLLDDLHWADEASVELVLHLLRRPPRGAAPARLRAAAGRPGPAAPGRGAPRAGFAGARARAARPRRVAALLAGVRDRRRASALARGRRQPAVPAGARARGAGPAARFRATLLAAVGARGRGARARRARCSKARRWPATRSIRSSPRPPRASRPTPAALDALVAADLVRAAGAGARSRSATRSCAAPSTTARRRAGGWPRMSAPRPCWASAAPSRRARLPRRALRPPGRRGRARGARGGGRATAGSSPATAAHWYGAALRLAARATTARRAGAAAPMALALAGAGRLAESRAALVDALELLGRARALALVTACAQVETELGRHAAARRRLLAALAGARPSTAPGLAFELAAAAFYDGRGRVARALARRRAAAEAGDPLLLAGADALARSAPVERRATPPRRGLERATSGSTNSTTASSPRARQRSSTQRRAAPQAALRRLRGDDAARRSRSRAPPAGPGPRAIDDAPSMALRGCSTSPPRTRIQAAEETPGCSAHPAVVFALWPRAVVVRLARADRRRRACRRRIRGLVPGSSRATSPARALRRGRIRAHQDPERAIREVVSTAGPVSSGPSPAGRPGSAGGLVRTAIAVGAGRQAEPSRPAPRTRAPAIAGRPRASELARAEILLARGDAARAA